MNGSEIGETTDEVTRLVRTVERLAVADQERILRIVSLLAMAPSPVQRRTQRMLKELLDSAPGTMRECVSGVEEVIEYLEDNLLSQADAPARFESTACPPWSGRHN